VHIVNDAYTLMTKVTGIVMKFEVMFSPDAGTLKAYGCDFSPDNSIAGLELRVWAFHKLEPVRLGNSQNNVALGQSRALRSWVPTVILESRAGFGNDICVHRLYVCAQVPMKSNKNARASTNPPVLKSH